MNKYIIATTFLLLTNHLFSQSKTEALLIGTFHFNNPGMDVVKTTSFDVLSKKSQEELELFQRK